MFRNGFSPIFAVVLLAAPAAVAAPAAAQAERVNPDFIIVTASRSGDPVSASLVGSSVTVLDSDALESRQTRVLSDILRDVPGVAVSRTGAIGGLTQVHIRGAEGNHVLVFVDGIKASDPYQGEYDFGTLLADEAGRVEVLRGPQSSLYGSDAIGGVISYTTLSGREAPGVTARAEGGSMGTFSTAGRVGGVVGEDFDYALSASYLTTSGYPTAPGGERRIGSDNLGTSLKLNWTPTADFRLTGVLRYSYTKADLNDQMISADSPLVQGYPVITAVDTPDSWFRNKAVYGLLRAELDLLDDVWTTALSGQVADTRRDAYNAFGYSYGDRGRRYRGSFENSFRFGSERLRNNFTFAVDAEREEFRAVDPSGFAFTGKHRLDSIGFVADYGLIFAERLALNASARIDHSNRFDDAATWRLTGSYLFDSGTRLHAAWGSGVKSPTASDLFGYTDGQYIGNPTLSPERSRGWEAGIEQNLLDKRLILGTTWFQSDFTDRIETVGAFIEGRYIATSINSAFSARQRGIEAYAHARLGDWRADASYTWLDAPQVMTVLAGPAPAGDAFQAAVPIEAQAVHRPKHSGSFNLSYAPEAMPLSATLSLRYSGRRTDYAFNSMYQLLLVDMKAYTLVNFAAAFDVTPALQVYGRIENLLDTDYQEVFTFATPGRAAYGGVRIRF